jgi:adenosylmethionine-8-amino-7-oxononanoate aminotransferase
LVSDEVIAAFGRFGALFACERFGYQPDIVTFAKGVTSGYAPLGGMVVSDRVAEPFVTTGEMFLHGFTFAGHPVSCAVAMANLDILEGEDLPGRVLANEGAFRATLERLGDLPIVGDIRGTGYFYALELVRDPATRATFSPAEADHLLRAIISNRLLDLGLICRADDRGDPVITLAPPLVAGEEEFDMIERVLRQVLVEAQAEMGVR